MLYPTGSGSTMNGHCRSTTLKRRVGKERSGEDMKLGFKLNGVEQSSAGTTEVSGFAYTSYYGLAWSRL